MNLQDLISCCLWTEDRLRLKAEMTSPTKYPAPQEGDGVLLRLREDYEQAVLDLFEADQAAIEVRPGA